MKEETFSSQLIRALAIVTVFLIPITARVQMGINALYCEIALYALVPVVLLLRGRNTPHILLALIGLWSVIAALALGISDGRDITLASIRNISSMILMFFVMLSPRFSTNTIYTLYRVFVIAAVASCIVGIWQTLYGYDHSVTVINLGLLPVSVGSRNLTDVLNWKLNNLHRSGLSFWQKDLAIGFFTFSNNLSEFLVYALIALCGLRRARRMRSTIFMSVASLFFFAIICSASRTGMLAAAMVIAHHFYRSANKPSYRLIALYLIFAAVVIGVPALIYQLFSYDAFGTVSGRSDLDIGAIRVITSSVKSVLFGGNVGLYYTYFLQDPHSVIIYVWLYYGAFSAFAFTIVTLLIIRKTNYLFKTSSNREAKVICDCGLMASLWFFLYGMTWSVIGAAQSGMMWALFAGSALGLSRLTLKTGRQGNLAAARVPRTDNLAAATRRWGGVITQKRV